MSSTGGIIALGLGIERWPVEACITHFVNLVDKAFTRRLPGIHIGSKYKTRPFVQALRSAFKDDCLFGGKHETYNSYHTKVALTSASETGTQAILLTNYNRPLEPHCMINNLFYNSVTD